MAIADNLTKAKSELMDALRNAPSPEVSRSLEALLSKLEALQRRMKR